MFGFIEVHKDGKRVCFNVHLIDHIYESFNGCEVCTNKYNFTVDESYEEVKHMIDLSKAYSSGFGSDLTKIIKRV